MTPRLAAAIKEFDAAVEEEVERRLAARLEAAPVKVDEIARERARRGLKKRGMLPVTFGAKAK